MSRLIDADALRETIYNEASRNAEVYTEQIVTPYQISFEYYDIEEYIDNAPTVDAVPIRNDGTLEVKVPNAQKVGRVLVMDTDSHIGGGLFYPADAVQGEWNTGKPTKCGKYIVTLIGIGNYRFVDIMHYDKPCMPNREVSGECWYRDDDEWGDVVYDDKDIIAWIPLPTPYKGGDDE